MKRASGNYKNMGEQLHAQKEVNFEHFQGSAKVY